MSYDPNLTVSHTLNLANLRAETKYSLEISSTDANKAVGTSIVQFKTLVGLLISNIQANHTQASITVTWNTNYPANSQIIVCSNWFTCIWTSPIIDPILTQSHSMTVSGLKSGATYNYQVISKDSNGYTANTWGRATTR